MKLKLTLITSILFLVLPVFGQRYMEPPKEIMDVLNAPAIPSTSISPSRDRIALLVPLRYPPISELAQPMLRIAGLRINPNSNSQHRQPYFVGLTLKTISNGKEMPIALPANAQIFSPLWSPDGKYLAFGNITPVGVELWILDAAAGKLQKVKNVYLNTAFGGFSWENSLTLTAMLVPAKRGPAPQYQNLTPTEPNIQETSGRSGAVQTFQDLMKSPNDERLFEYYCTSQPAVIDASGRVREVGPTAIYNDFEFSPDGKYML
ncbi:MAG TPA: hypothetical protein VGQ55_04020, partial [Pyrinomonadaceae bacterium]|nr:hypothetical protein [Pyrinomonadaceae bacterium]